MPPQIIFLNYEQSVSSDISGLWRVANNTEENGHFDDSLKEAVVGCPAAAYCTKFHTLISMPP